MLKLKFKNQNYYSKIYAVIFILTFCTLNFYGCATYPRRAEVKKPSLPVDKTFRIGRTDYIYLKDLCQAYDLVWDWDILGKRLTLYREGLKINLAIGSSLGLLNEQRIALQDKVRIYNYEIVIPFILSEEIAKIIFPSQRVPPGIYKIKCVVIDPGHGGKDPGAVGPGGIKEKDVVLDIAKKLKKFLENRGIEVILTREKDKFVSLWRRKHLANTKRADLFISIHANSSRWRQARGFEVYYLSDRMDESSKALVRLENAGLEFEEGQFFTENTALAATLWDIVQTQNRAQAIRLANKISECMEKIDWVDNRGIKGANFYVLKGVHIPAVLIEVGFLSNSSEEHLLKNAYYRQQIAEAIVQGIEKYANELALAQTLK
ncbi:MAG: N-acetylmuramoyl-L-alanine amidase [Candidatus Omnitrophota bacterium]